MPARLTPNAKISMEAYKWNVFEKLDELAKDHWQKGDGQSKGDFRAHSPRFQGKNVERNLALVEALRQIAEKYPHLALD